MDSKDFLDLFKYIIGIMAIIVIVYMILKSGFILRNIKIDFKGLNIEISGQEKSVQPDQE